MFYLAAIGGIPLQRLRVTWLIPLAWLAFTWSRMRNGPLFSILAAIALGDLLPHACWVDWLSRRGSEVFRIPSTGSVGPVRRVGFLTVLLPFVLVLSSLALQWAGLRVPLLGQGWAGLDTDASPVEILPALRATNGLGPPARRSSTRCSMVDSSSISPQA